MRLDYKAVSPIVRDVSSDNDRHNKTSCCSQSQKQSRKKIVSFPLQSIKVSSKFGYRTDPFTKKRRFHSGIDLKASKGTEAYAMLAGVIEKVGRDESRGNYIMIRHDEYVVTYCHLSRILVSQGQIVEPGGPVGLVGSTGRSTGPHLHIMLHRGRQLLNPQILLDSIRNILDRDGNSQAVERNQRV